MFVFSLIYSTPDQVAAISDPTYFPPDSYLPGQIICDKHTLSEYTVPTGTGACYMLYEDPSIDPSGDIQRKYKKYIGQTQTLASYLKVGPESLPGYPFGTGLLNNGYYPQYPLGVNMPCGTIVGDKATGEIYISQPYDTYGDQGDAPDTFAYSDTFLFKVPALNTASLRAYVQPNRIVWLPRITSDVPNLINDGFSLPTCTIVKQQGSSAFYRLTGYVDGAGRHNIRKQYISNVDTLNMWLAWTPYYLEADISYYPQTRNAPLPPGLLVSSRSGGAIYFTDDLGYKVQIPSMEVLSNLGYALPTYKKNSSTGNYEIVSYWLNPGILLRVSDAALSATPSL